MSFIPPKVWAVIANHGMLILIVVDLAIAFCLIMSRQYIKAWYWCAVAQINFTILLMGKAARIL